MTRNEYNIITCKRAKNSKKKKVLKSTSKARSRHEVFVRAFQWLFYTPAQRLATWATSLKKCFFRFNQKKKKNQKSKQQENAETQNLLKSI